MSKESPEVEQSEHPPTLKEQALAHVWIHGAQYTRLADEGVLILERGDGCNVWDTEGKRYFDAHAGIFLVNVGYGRHEIVDAVADQMG